MTIAITGQNDNPVVTSNAAAAAGAVTEAGNLDNGTIVIGAPSATGTLTSSDVDNPHTATWSGDAAGLYGTFAIDPANGKWTYSLNNFLTATQGLKEGDVKTEIFTATVTDDKGATATSAVSVTINGTNDSPVITSDAHTETIAETDAALTTSGQIVFSDVDTGDTPQASVTLRAVTASGILLSVPQASAFAFAFSVTNAATGTWSFNLPAADSQFLADGDHVDLVYTVTVTDSFGAHVAQDVTIRITGTNDGPVLSDTMDPAAVNELTDASAQDIAAITGTFGVTDLDIGDTLSPSVVGSPVVMLDGVAAALPAGAAALIDAAAFTLTGSTSNGGATSVGYSYDPGAANLDFLSASDTLTITYAVKVNDGLADSATQDVTITIHGTNDGPVAVDDAIGAAGGGVFGTIKVAVVYDGAIGGPTGLADQLNDHTFFNTFDASAVRYDQVDTIAELDQYDIIIPAMSYFEAGSEEFYSSLKDWVLANHGGVITTDWFAYKMNGNTLSTAQLSAADFITPIGRNSSGWAYSPGAAYSINSGHPITDGITVLTGVGQWSATGVLDINAHSLATFTGASNNFFNDPWSAIAYTDETGIGRQVWLGGFYSDAQYQEPGVRTGIGDKLLEQAVNWAAGGGNTFTNEDTAKTISTAQILANDTDVDNGDILTVTAVSALSANGASVTLSGADIVYDPTAAAAVQALAAGDTLTDTFTYTISDGNGGTDTATVSVVVAGVNDAATITASGAEDTTVSEDGGTGNATLGDPSAHGQLTVHDVDTGQDHFLTPAPASLTGAYGDFTFNALTGEWGYTLDQSRADAIADGVLATDTFVAISADSTATYAVEVAITGANDAPTLSPINAGALADTTAVDTFADLTGTLAGSDPDTGAVLSYGLTASGQSATGTYGALTIDAATGGYTYVANAAAINALPDGAATSDVFHVRVTDEFGLFADATLTVNVTGANDLPVAPPINASASEDGPFAVDLLAGATDVDLNDTLTITDANIVNIPTTGGRVLGAGDYTVTGSTFELTAQGLAQFNNLAGTDSDSFDFSFNVSDGHDVTARTLHATITGVNDAPVAVADTGSAFENETKSFDVVANDTDVDTGDVRSLLSIDTISVASSDAAVNGIDATAAFGVSGGQIAFNGTTFDALGTGQTATVTIDHTVQDSQGATSAAALTITVTGVNDDASIAASPGGDYSVIENGGPNNTSIGDPTAGGQLTVTDVDHGEAHFAVPASLTGTYGDFMFNAATGDWSYLLDQIRAQSLSGAAPVTETLSVASFDGTANYTVNVTVNGANDAPVFTGEPYVFATNENNPVGASVGTVHATDPDIGNSQYYEFANGTQTSGLFDINRATGAITANAALDFETAASHNLSVVVRDRDGGGLTDTASVTVNVGDVAEGTGLASHKLTHANVLVFDNGAYVDTFGGAGSESDNMQAGLISLGHSVSTTTSITAAGLSAALLGEQVFVIPEQETGFLGPALSQSAEDAITNFVATGGTLVVSCDYRGLLESLFEFPGIGGAGFGSGTATKTAQAIGTTFADDAAALSAFSFTNELFNLPTGSLNVYSDGNGSTVAVIPFGNGQIVHLGWDWFAAQPVGSQDGGWLQVLDSSISTTGFIL